MDPVLIFVAILLFSGIAAALADAWKQIDQKKRE